jgi:hypothetical protein
LIHNLSTPERVSSELQVDGTSESVSNYLIFIAACCGENLSSEMEGCDEFCMNSPNKSLC